MSLPSFANYNLVASTTNVQNCNASNVTIAAFVCGNQPSSLVTINDDGACASSNDTQCFFTPASITVTAGVSVTWHNNGNLGHDVVSNSASNGSLPSFGAYLNPGNSFSQQFLKTGTYYYYDLNRPWIKGSVLVTQAVAPPPVIASFAAGGTIGWNVAGLDQNDALLGVSHRINVYDQTSPQQPLVYNESGLFEQSIDLGTRVESPTTIGLLQSLPFGLSFYGFNNGYGYGFGGYGYPGPYGYYPGPFFNFQPVHTLWWVNGPLDNGSVVELLTGYASVTGSKAIGLGSGLGTQDAWAVTSAYTQNSNQATPQSSNNFYYCPFGPYFGGFQPQPQPQCYVSQSNFSVSLNANYGQHSDLLFSFSSEISSLTQTTTDYPAGSTVYGSNNGFSNNGISAASPVSVIRTTSSKLTFTLSLSNTNLDLAKRMTLQPTQSSSSTGSTTSGGTGASSPSPTSNQPLNMSMIYFAAGAGAAVLASGAVWAISRSRRKATAFGPPPVAMPTP